MVKLEFDLSDKPNHLSPPSVNREDIMRSRSFEVPRDSLPISNPDRPHFTRASISHNQVIQKTPAAFYTHDNPSLAQSIASISLYANFAGERFNQKENRPTDQASRRPSEKKSFDVRQVETATGKPVSPCLVAYSDSYSSDSSTPDSCTKQRHERFNDLEKTGSDTTPKASVGKAMFMFLKAFIGSGVLFLPKAFEHGGLVLSSVLMILIASICLFAFLRLVETQLVIGGSYGDIGGVLFGNYLRYIVLFFIVISQMGFVASYFVFISGNLVNVADVLSFCHFQIEQRYYIWFPFVVIAPVVLVRHIAKLSFTAIVADIFILFGLICCIYFTASELHESGLGPEVKYVNPTSFALMIGTATFSFEGIGLVIPIVESMQQPERFPFVVTVGMIIVCTIYILIGGISYMAYGNHIQAAVVYNFPKDNPLTVSVQILYSLAIILTAPLMLFPAIKILENAVFTKFKSGKESFAVKWSKNVFRVFLLGICALVAFCIGANNLDIFVSLVGSIACVPLCFIFPGMFHYKITKKTKDKVFDILLCLFGVGIMVYTLYVSVSSFLNPEEVSFELPPYCPKPF